MTEQTRLKSGAEVWWWQREGRKGAEKGRHDTRMAPQLNSGLLRSAHAAITCSHLVASALFTLCVLVRGGGSGALLCVFVAKPCIVCKSGATLLSQWARAKVLKDPDPTWPPPRCHCDFWFICVWLWITHWAYKLAQCYSWMSKSRHLHSQRKQSHTQPHMHTPGCTHIRG